jgi:hypothetical protein
VREASFLRSLLHLFYLFGFDRRLIILRKRVFLVVVLEESLTFCFCFWGGVGKQKEKTSVGQFWFYHRVVRTSLVLPNFLKKVL